MDILKRLQAALAGRYEVEHELGRGGMAVVFLGHDLRLERRVAIKVFEQEGASGEGTERFLREIRVAAQLQHPNILPVFESGEGEGLVYYVMPYVAGQSLRERLEKEGPLPVAEAVRIAREVALALDHAHGAGIVHRDIKPDNVLLSGGVAVVADFGVARAVAEAGSGKLTGTGMAVGTPNYMSPEQATAQPTVDGRADIYALGCVLYEMLAGTPPFSGPTAQAVMARHTVDAVPPLSTVREVPPALEAAVVKALAKAPADRWATGRAFAEALAEAAGARALGRTGAPALHNTWARFGLAAAIALIAVAAAWVARARPFAGARTDRSSSIAVLPLRNLGHDSDAYFAEGLTEGLTNGLARVGSLVVRAYSSVSSAAVREGDPIRLGERLGVEYVLTGSVRRSTARFRVTVELVRVSDGVSVWAPSSFDGDRAGDIFLAQDSITGHLVGELVGRIPGVTPLLASGQGRRDPVAYDLYLRGRHSCNRWTEEGFNRGIGYYRRAIDQDPTFALAYAGLAECYGTLSAFAYATPESAYPRAKAAVMRALELDSTYGQAYAALGGIRFGFEYDWPGADSAFRRAVALAPADAGVHYAYTPYLTAMGRFDEAIAEGRRAIELDPLTLTTSLQLGWIYFNARRYEESIAQLQRTLELDTSFAYTHMELAWNYVMLRRFPEATRECALALKAGSPDDQVLLGSCGWVYGRAGRRSDALRLLQQLMGIARRRWVDPYNVAGVYAGLGDMDQGFEWLRRAVRERSGSISALRVDPWLDVLRSDSRFPLLLREVGLSN